MPRGVAAEPSRRRRRCRRRRSQQRRRRETRTTGCEALMSHAEMVAAAAVEAAAAVAAWRWRRRGGGTAAPAAVGRHPDDRLRAAREVGARARDAPGDVLPAPITEGLARRKHATPFICPTEGSAGCSPLAAAAATAARHRATADVGKRAAIVVGRRCRASRSPYSARLPPLRSQGVDQTRRLGAPCDERSARRCRGTAPMADGPSTRASAASGERGSGRRRPAARLSRVTQPMSRLLARASLVNLWSPAGGSTSPTKIAHRVLMAPPRGGRSRARRPPRRARL